MGILSGGLFTYMHNLPKNFRKPSLALLDFLEIKADRHIHSSLAKSIFHISGGKIDHRMEVKIHHRSSHILILVIGDHCRQLTDPHTGTLQDLEEFTVPLDFIESTDDICKAPVFRHFFHRPVELPPLHLFRREMLAHRRQHVAVDKIHLRVRFGALPVDEIQIDIQEMLHAARIEQHACRLLRHLIKYSGDALDDHVLEVTAQDVVVRELQHGETVHSPHLLRGQDNAAKAAARTHKNLVAARDEHRRVRDRPCAAGRRRV